MSPKKRNPSFIQNAGGAVLILLLAVGAGFIVNKSAKHPLPLFHMPAVSLQIVDLSQALLLHDQQIPFVDARPAETFRDGHISGAQNLDYYNFDQIFPAFLKNNDRSAQLVVYCEGISGEHNEDTCETSRLLARQLQAAGYTRVILFQQGYAFWEKAGYPVVTGMQASSAAAGHRIPLSSYLRDLIMVVLGLAGIFLGKRRAATIVVQLVLGAVFITAGIHKILGPEKLAVIIDAYRILPSPAVNFAAVVMPWAELLSGICLIAGVLPVSGTLVIGAMNLFFIPAIGYRGLLLAKQLGISFFSVNFDCGCGLGDNFAWVLVLRDAGFLLMAVAILASNLRWRVALFGRNR